MYVAAGKIFEVNGFSCTIVRAYCGNHPNRWSIRERDRFSVCGLIISPSVASCYHHLSRGMRLFARCGPSPARRGCGWRGRSNPSGSTCTRFSASRRGLPMTPGVSTRDALWPMIAGITDTHLNQGRTGAAVVHRYQGSTRHRLHPRSILVGPRRDRARLAASQPTAS